MSVPSWPAIGGPPPKGSVAWVVGAGNQQGTGASLVRRLADEGLHVVITGRTQEKVDRLADEVRSNGGAATAVAADAGTESELSRVLDVVDGLGNLSVAIYNAGGSQWRKSLLDMDADFFESVWRTNCLGSFVMAREAARRMQKSGGGAIMFTGSISGRIARPKLGAYAAAKFAQRSLVESFAREFGPQGIHVANVIPHGPIDGDRLNGAFPDAKSQRPEDSMIDPDRIADTFWQLLTQPRNAWTLEADLRPYCETFAI